MQLAAIKTILVLRILTALIVTNDKCNAVGSIVLCMFLLELSSGLKTRNLSGKSWFVSAYELYPEFM